LITPRSAIVFAQLSLVAGMASAAPVQDATLFGVTIGRTIDSYPSCDSEEGKRKICAYPHKWGPGDSREIELRPEHPAYLASNLHVALKGDVIDSFYVDTDGIGHQDELFELLRARYGKPSQFKRTIIQNRFGAMFPKVEASWKLTGGTLIFRGVEESIDRGSLGIVGEKR